MRHALMFVVCLTCGAALAAEPPSEPKPASSKSQSPASASVRLEPTKGNSVSGMLTLNTDRSGVRIAGTIEGLQPNAEQGFHIHEKGDCSAPDASSAGAHFNPTKQPHGNPKTSGPRHLGDMVNLRADAKGTAKVDVRIDGATLQSGQANDVAGKAIVVHQKADDYATQPSGNSGDRVACGVISAR